MLCCAILHSFSALLCCANMDCVGWQMPGPELRLCWQEGWAGWIPAPGLAVGEDQRAREWNCNERNDVPRLTEQSHHPLSPSIPSSPYLTSSFLSIFSTFDTSHLFPNRLFSPLPHCSASVMFCPPPFSTFCLLLILFLSLFHPFHPRLDRLFHKDMLMCMHVFVTKLQLIVYLPLMKNLNYFLKNGQTLCFSNQ